MREAKRERNAPSRPQLVAVNLWLSLPTGLSQNLSNVLFITNSRLRHSDVTFVAVANFAGVII